jgi:hypothetical protein
VGVFLSVLGAVSLIAAIVLQFAKVTLDGTSLNASQANGICQSALGQLGQAFSSGFGDSTPTSLCHKAAMIEDWKGITVWLAIVLIVIGVVLMVRGAGLMPGRPAGQSAQAGTAAQMPAHLMPAGPMPAGPMPASPMPAGPMGSAQPPAPQAQPDTPGMIG